jgi:hypothetical protein
MRPDKANLLCGRHWLAGLGILGVGVLPMQRPGRLQDAHRAANPDTGALSETHRMSTGGRMPWARRDR